MSITSVVNEEVTYSTEIHLFHHQDFSQVWTLVIKHGGRCALTGEHLHTARGEDIHVRFEEYALYGDAEAYVDDLWQQHQDAPHVLGPVELVRHRDDADGEGCEDDEEEDDAQD